MLVLPTTYFGPISYYAALYHAPEVMIEAQEHYMKQTYRTRCRIASPNGPQWLTIPVVHDDASHSAIRDIEISGHGNWQHLHWQALWTAYEGSPFFEFYADDIRPFYEKTYRFLFDFTEGLRQTMCQLLGISPHVELTSQYNANPEGFEDLRTLINPKNPIPDKLFFPQPYYQTFRDKLGFLPNLSIVDLLFNMGPESVLVLRDSLKICDS